MYVTRVLQHNFAKFRDSWAVHIECLASADHSFHELQNCVDSTGGAGFVCFAPIKGLMR